MDYKRQVGEIVKYIKAGEKTREEYRIGVEFEHFVIDLDSYETVSYYGENGVAETLEDMTRIGYKGEIEGDHILGLKKGVKNVSLEPGSQLELSIDARKTIKELEEEYLEFIRDIIPILERKNQGLLNTGYHPVTKIDEIRLLPKKRYDFMFNYFKSRGSHAHNMMKGTAALQIGLDYESEEDYRKKFQIANALSPVLYTLFENAYYFEGRALDMHNIRSYIWENCDSHRSGLVEGALDKDFGYERYGEYILNRPPIFINQDGEEVFTNKKLVREIFDPEDYKIEELEHLLTMFFPDVRTKQFIEIRMMDSIPYPLNFSSVALLVGLIYDDENVDELYKYIEDISIEDVNKAKEEMRDKGLEGRLKGEKLLDIGNYLVKLAEKGLEGEDKLYLNPLKKMLKKEVNPYIITRSKARERKREAVNWCLLNNIIKE